MPTIKDGKGTGKKAEVNNDNELMIVPTKKMGIEYATGTG